MHTNPDVLTVRAEIEAEIAGMTLPDAFAATVAERGDTPAYSDKIGIDMPAP